MKPEKVILVGFKESEYEEIVKRLVDILEVDQQEYTPEQVSATDLLLDRLRDSKDIGMDTALWDLHRLFLNNNFDLIIRAFSEEYQEEANDMVEGVIQGMEAVSDRFWPEVTNGYRSSDGSIFKYLKERCHGK